MRLANTLRETRGKRTMKQISQATGIPMPYLSDLERGARLPKDEWVARLESAYGKPIGELYDFWGSSDDGDHPRRLALIVPDEVAA